MGIAQSFDFVLETTVHRCFSMKIGVLKHFSNYTGKHLCSSLFMFSSKYWKTLRNSFKRTALLIEHLRWLLLLYALLQNLPSLPIILLLALFSKLISLQTFFPVTSSNVGIRPQNFLTSSFNRFATLV